MNYNPFIVNISEPYEPDYGRDGLLPLSTRKEMTKKALKASWHTREPITNIQCVIFKTPNQQAPWEDNVEPRNWGYGWLPHHHFSGPDQYPPLEMSDDQYEAIYKTTLESMKEIIETSSLPGIIETSSLPDPWRVGSISIAIIHSVRSEQDIYGDIDYTDTRKITYTYSLCGKQHWTSVLPTPTTTDWTFRIEQFANAKPRPPLP